ncbi:MAG: D-alanyl-D-alanine carboxypeptidase (penicillin-binding protein 5/6) [Enterobacterales bacterium]|jgi:D-alanyl-D-alanine carboxypeptidase (penicillin-binding protein 5/6)
MSRLTTILRGFFILLSLSAGSLLAIIPKAPEMSGNAYVLMDYDTGQILVAKNANLQVPPSSLTKMMTSYVLSFEVSKGNISYEDKVTISKNAWAKNFPGSSLMFIEVDTEVLLEDLKRGVIISSGNDASVAVAEHIAGSEQGFAELMNYHAKTLGMNDTYFINSNGLPDENHLTTAHDMAILAQALIRDFPDDYEVYKEKEFTYNGIRQYNRNSLLWDRSMNVDGVKTGHTEAGGYSLVASATRDNMRLISVVLGTNSKSARKQQNKRLLNFGFRFYETVEPVRTGQILHSQRLWYGEKEKLALGLNQTILLTIPRGDGDKLKATFSIEGELEAPISKGQIIGTVYFELEGKKVKELPLVALEAIAEAGMWSQFTDYLSKTVDSWVND